MQNPTFLEVPFAEKDEAKQLGARWNPQARKWYVPAGLETSPFSRWLGHQLSDAQPHPQDSTEVTQGISLRALLAQVDASIARGVPRSQWIRAEISQARLTAGGHLQLELIEQDGEGQLVARLPAFLWASQAEAVNQRFERATGSPLAAGLKVLLQVSVDHNPVFGLRAVVEAVDPSYTLGDLARKLESIRNLLKERGLYDLNRSLPEPAEFTQVWVLSPKDAAGLGDFRELADRLAAAGVCRFRYYTAVFQGPEAAQSLLAALQTIVHDLGESGPVDALCLIRGGGAVTDLAWLNEFELAERLCQLNFPVFTGIGHERDSTILDEVANRRFDTPSKVIGQIAGTLYANASAATEHVLQILGLTRTRLAQAEAETERLMEGILNQTQTLILSQDMALGCLWSEIRENNQGLLIRAEAHLDRMVDGLQHALAVRLSLEEKTLDELLHRLWERGGSLLQEAGTDLEGLAREILGMGPEATLRRGYLLARDPEGRLLTSRAEALKSSTIELQFKDGRLITHPERRNDA